MTAAFEIERERKRDRERPLSGHDEGKPSERARDLLSDYGDRRVTKGLKQRLNASGQRARPFLGSAANGFAGLRICLPSNRAEWRSWEGSC